MKQHDLLGNFSLIWDAIFIIYWTAEYILILKIIVLCLFHLLLSIEEILYVLMYDILSLSPCPLFSNFSYHPLLFIFLNFRISLTKNKTLGKFIEITLHFYWDPILLYWMYLSKFSFILFGNRLKLFVHVFSIF